MNQAYDRGTRYAWNGWVLLFLATAAIVIADSSRSVLPAYTIGSRFWFAGKDLYDGIGEGGFVYFPQAALLFIPIELLPPVAGEVVWRLLNIGAFAIGIGRFARMAGGGSATSLFPLMTLVSIPLAWDCARNGQANLMITGLMLLAVADIAGERPWRAALWLVLAVAFKPLAIVLVLLIMAVDRPMAWRLALGLLVLALVPFAAQHPSYVLRQYAGCVQNMMAASHLAVAAPQWTTPFSALKLIGVVVSEQVQMMIRLAAALATLGLVWFAWTRKGAADRALFAFSLAMAYLMLFSPRTENNTYAMLGPAIAVFLARAFSIEKKTGDGVFLAVLALALVGSYKIEGMLAPHAQRIWLSPIVAFLFTAFVIVRLFTGGERAAGGGTGAPSDEQRGGAVV